MVRTSCSHAVCLWLESTFLFSLCFNIICALSEYTLTARLTLFVKLFESAELAQFCKSLRE